ncbi:MAG TPA: flagellar hook-associated protein 3, partial [Pseudobdellovibrionaceae bacterium]|nr:flagellar hook-associated protein 3 [Pseudobdellovibrionaceae bacterium]
RTQAAPFDQDGTYFGDDGNMQVQTHKDAFIAMNLPGNRVFLGKGIGGDGVIRSKERKPRTVDEIGPYQDAEMERIQLEQENESERLNLTVPDTQMHKRARRHLLSTDGQGINVFQVLKGLEISLRANDKESVQQTMDQLDDAISQVVLSRSEVGARVMAVNGTIESLQKTIVDSRGSASSLEDADVFQVVSDISKTDSALRATLETSSKLVERNLLDFLR